jgi:drug/metabolite transporter (DMT)-like permease
MYLRYIGLFLVTGLGGIVSGLLWLVPNGLMGGALGMSLSAGTLWLGLKQTREGATPSDQYALLTGAAAGLLGGVSMAAISVLCAGVKRHELGPPALPVWAPLVMGVLYGVVLLWSYHKRLTTRRPLWHTLLKACGLCFLLKAVATFIYVGLIEHHASDLKDLATASVLSPLVGAVPFALFWVLATAWLDPAWSLPPTVRQNGAEAVPIRS